ncbi:hypothetical protein [Thermocrinis minervae]|uniref:hypothetical protein n=1 Tax=Thermocrinis minervae TaxID=381751 RepID=UPI0009A6C1CA|nr:hypothetical protein [Thermocrinis minervae]
MDTFSKVIAFLREFDRLHFRQIVGLEYTHIRDALMASLFLEYFGLDNPLGVYTLDLYPYLLEEFHLWHKSLGQDRSSSKIFPCC